MKDEHFGPLEPIILDTDDSYTKVSLKLLLQESAKVIVNSFRETPSESSREHAEWLLGEIEKAAELTETEQRLLQNKERIAEVFEYYEFWHG